MAERVALVTGASRGIGRGIALELARAGYDVMVNYAGNREAALETKALVGKAGCRAEVCRADVANQEDARRLVAATMEAFGRIDLLVNNAGIAPRIRADLLEATAESYDEVLATNLRGPYFLTQMVANRMIERIRAGAPERGRIVNVSSISSFTSSPSRGEYCVSKSGLSMMTKLFADRLAEFGITVNEVQPGIIETDMTGPVHEKYDRLIADGLTPIRRWGKPEDVGRAVAAIASGYLDFTTGAAIPVDGGFHLRRL
jgi:3-oxoacyl-[acyl-carrier protein] reductase